MGTSAWSRRSGRTMSKPPADIIAWYEGRGPELLEKLEQLPDEKLAASTSFFGMFDYPAVLYLNFLVLHTVHHRGQLSTYLRANGRPKFRRSTVAAPMSRSRCRKPDSSGDRRNRLSYWRRSR